MTRLTGNSAAALLTLVACFAAAECRAWIPEKLRDPEDGSLDLSEYLLRHSGVLPVPIIVTEPAVGYGAGVAAVYFSQSFAERAAASRARGERVTPPDISVVAALGTENGTRAFGVGHLGFWDQDRWRYAGFVGKPELVLDYYGVNGEPRGYRLEAAGLLQQLLRRLGDSNWFAGARYVYISTESRFEGERPADVEPRNLDTAIGKLGVVIDYDSRDNIFTPDRGTFFEVEAGFARRAFGSDTDHETLYARAFSFHRSGDFVLGVRGDARLSGGDVPFYAQPYVSLRGVPAVRYQDRHAVMAEAEVRWNLDRRWALVGFAGVGKAYGRRQSWDAAPTVGAGGAGFRYLVARQLNLYAGLDVARSKDDSAVYITVGHNWR